MTLADFFTIILSGGLLFILISFALAVVMLFVTLKEHQD